MNLMFQVGSWHYDKGGTDLFVKTIAHWLAKKGNKIIVLAHRLEEEDCKNEDLKIGKGTIKIRYTPKQKKGKRFNPFRYAYRLAITSYYLYKLAKKEKIDLIVVGETELLSTLSLKLLETKIVCRGGALMYETMSKEVLKEKGDKIYSNLFNLIIKTYNNITLKIPDVMVPVNKSEYEFMNRKKRKKSKITIISHGVDTNLFSPKKKKKESPKKIIIGYIGRLAPIKYPQMALEIFKESCGTSLKNKEFSWIGPLDPSYKNDFFEKLKEKVNIKNASYLGRIDNKKLPNYLAKLDIFLQVEQQKNVSRSTTEAAACGIPIVALNQGKEPYGFFTMDKQEAIEELKKLIQNEEYRREKSKKAREIILKDYSEDKIYKKYLDLFKELKNEN